MDCTVRFAACEDVIIHGMVAARPVDQEDVRHMVAKNRMSPFSLRALAYAS